MQDSEEAVNYFEYGPENSRGFRALKIWLALRQVGREGYAQMIGDDIRLAQTLFELAAAHPELQAFRQGLSIATFRYVPRDLQPGDEKVEEYLNQLNSELMVRLQKSGEAFLTNAVIGGAFVLRACIVNFRTSLADIRALPGIIARLGAELDADAAAGRFAGDARSGRKIFNLRRSNAMWEYDQPMKLKVGLAEMLKGGVIMDVTTAEQAKIAEDAGACAVMALERVPADIRKEGGVARMASIKIIKEIMGAVTIPVMAKARIGHFAEAQVLEAVGVDYIDESEVLTPADEEHHIRKWGYKVPFVCGARNLGEALRRIGEGAAMIRTKGEAGSGNIVEAVRHIRAITSEIRQLTTLREEELMAKSKELGSPYDLVKWVSQNGKLPVPNFSAGGIATPADASLVMQLGAEAVFVGSGIFKSSDPAQRAKAIVRATTHYNEPLVVAECSAEVGEAMKGLDVQKMDPKELLQTRGW